jgi:hypothetical protein
MPVVPGAGTVSPRQARARAPRDGPIRRCRWGQATTRQTASAAWGRRPGWERASCEPLTSASPVQDRVIHPADNGISRNGRRREQRHPSPHPVPEDRPTGRRQNRDRTRPAQLTGAAGRSTPKRRGAPQQGPHDQSDQGVQTVHVTVFQRNRTWYGATVSRGHTRPIRRRTFRPGHQRPQAVNLDCGNLMTGREGLHESARPRRTDSHPNMGQAKCNP